MTFDFEVEANIDRAIELVTQRGDGLRAYAHVRIVQQRREARVG